MIFYNSKKKCILKRTKITLLEILNLKLDEPKIGLYPLHSVVKNKAIIKINIFFIF